MTIIAIDPGPTHGAIVEWDGKTVRNPGILPNSALRIDLGGIAQRALVTNGEVRLAIEMIACYGMPVGAETFETCVEIGRLMEIWESKYPTATTRVFRKDIKLHICGTVKAKDGNIRQALIDRFGPVGTKNNQGPLYGVSSHLWAALAVAVYAHDTASVRPGMGLKIEEIA